MIIDLVDRLSTPIQFMSLAEKRTKQMKGMGFDETDISDEALTSSSSSSVKQQPASVKPEQLPVLPASATTNDRATTTSQLRAAAPAATSQQLVVTTDKKDKKGDIKLLMLQAIIYETVLISL